ncbi:anaerobic ribonucleoside-triphosphate reductase activating protein [Mollicutes bacterium LVI A0039]|nr:anaerobic ribonucleoside-triphosphate reductase activating protein [Mollicutes bacterium LVI A0039]
MAKINLSGYIDSSIVDGPGVRFAVYTQGCIHKCLGCHNPKTWCTKPNQIIEIDDLIELINAESLGSNVTISGGDPLLQFASTYELCVKLKRQGYNIWLYTGYTLAEIEQSKQLSPILKTIDVLVDGKFEKELRDYKLEYRGSSNQNIIDCNKL